MMTLAEVPPATEIFLDANIFGYDFSGPTLLTPACSALLRHIEEGDITGYTSLIVVVEVLHRLMIIEATAAPQVETRQAVRYLKVHPA
jgi:predicted nucleic acid-binding protein